MSARLQTAAEVLKLARLLGVPPQELDYLGEVPADDLAALRAHITDRLFAGRTGLERVGLAARLVPSPLVAAIAQRAFGPLLCARAATNISPAKAVDVASRLPADFLADVAVELDPRRTADIIGQVPRELVVPVAKELGQREEYVTMGRFLAFVSDEAIAAAMSALSDEAMLRTAFVLEHKDALDHAVGLLPPDRLPGILREASRLNLWSEALDLVDHLSAERRGSIADVLAEQDEAVIARLVEAVIADDLWQSLLPIVGSMSYRGRTRLASQSPFHDEQVLRTILEAADASGMWGDLLPLVHALPDKMRARAAGMIPVLGAPAVAHLIEAVEGHHLWQTLLPVVRTMNEETRTALAAMEPFHRPDALRTIVTVAVAEDLWLDLLPLVQVLPAGSVETIAEVVTDFDESTIARLIDAVASTPDAWASMTDIFNGIDPAARSHVIAVIDHADRALGEKLVRSVSGVVGAPALTDNLPAEVLQALERAAHRLGLRAEFDRLTQP